MDIFENIVASLLIDVIKAQNRANEYSAKLVPNYRDPTHADPPQNPNLGFFPVPNSVIRSFDFKLSFTLDNSNEPVIPPNAAGTSGLPINFNLEVLKEAGEKMLASVSFQVDMRNYQLGFSEDTAGGTGAPGAPSQQHRLIQTG